ncbi:calcium-binding protein [Paraburkholderia bonniea]|uniref:calcium-binding protein n=1 Tax=Paraburkholderia bonniea TaxID=2152891 RepID=UPI0025729358|nr:calcium-binding protein [Paraburkholderia bonniea]WJF91652.1 calcium-binding protein [Paraburkholderia bonniea]WJF94970.1 calcium-binding protein [Paraburkholderia bonniea]
MARLNSGGSGAYAKYAESVISLTRAAAARAALGRASQLVDVMTLGIAIDQARHTGDWSKVAGTLGGMASSIQGASLAANGVVAFAAVASMYFGVAISGAPLAILIGLAGAGGAFFGGKYGSELSEALWSAFAQTKLYKDISAFFSSFSQSRGMIDPLILDLNGDGIHTTGVDQSSAHFDFAGEGSRTHTGWITTGDGFLVLDRNNNGAIDTGAELFSNFTKLANGMLAANGFDALREYDSNKDGVIDRHDAIWSSLKIWHDGNSDGMTQQGELLTLDQSGIVEIRLSKDGTIRTLENGNMVRGKGSFIQIVDGKHTEREMLEVWFGQDTLHQKFDTTIALRDDVTALPDINGAGNVRDLRQAASMETAEGAALRTLLRQVAAVKTTTEQHALIESLLKAWVATSSMTTTQTMEAAGQRRLVGENATREWAGRLTVLEKMAGTMLDARGDGVVILSPQRFRQIQRAWETLVHSVYVAVASQTTWKPYLDAIRYRFDANGRVSMDFSGMVALLQTASGRVGTIETALLMTELIRQHGEGWRANGFALEAHLQRYVAAHDSAALRAALAAVGVHYGAGDVEGGAGADLLLGIAGSTRLTGGAGDDLLLGTSGDEKLNGGTGSDQYFFGRNSGNDTINDEHDLYEDDVDVLNFDADVLPEDVMVKRDGYSNDLLVTIRGATNVLRIKDQLYQSGEKFVKAIEQFKFANGTIWSKDEVALMTLKSTSGNDVIYGFNGNDLMDGGAGDDRLYGGNGSDTYLFGRNSGNDTLFEDYDFSDRDKDVVQFDADVLPEDVTVKRDGSTDDLLVTIRGSANVLRISEQLRQLGQTFYKAIEQFKFANGTIWSKDEIALMTLQGTSGDDLLIGFNGDDLMDGGAGNDRLYGGNGSDTYLFGRNSGNDVIGEEYDFDKRYNDVVQFDTDVLPEDVMVKRDGESNDLLVTIKGATNVLRIKDQLQQHREEFIKAIEQFKFANGTTWSKDEVALMTLQGTSGDDLLIGFNGDDLMDGGAGNDRLYGGNGSDTYLFGRNSGNDVIGEEYDFDKRYNDVVQFDTDVLPEDVMVKRDGESKDLLITIKGATNVLRIKDQLNQHHEEFIKAIEQFKFANGTTWSKNEVALMTLKSTPGDDLLIGFNGDDILDGGSGTNTLAGGAGNDTYLHGRRSGHNTIEEGYDFDKRYIDVVRFDADIRPQDLTVSRELYTSNIVIKIDGSHTELRIIDQLVQHNDEYVKGIEQFVFADGTIWDKQTIAEKSARTPQIRSLMGWAAGENAHLHDPIGHMWKKYYAAGGKRAGEESFYADGTAPLPWSSRKSSGIAEAAADALPKSPVLPAYSKIERDAEAMYQGLLRAYATPSAATTTREQPRETAFFAPPLIASNIS